ncbi:Erd1 protein [Pichia kluyveri]|uniref:Erd1 protein n=1 Tax=Pichia kluyveri TaxID=36015 RepID=A0AAV5QZZ2_PICKL|nr:Erd1 protein [Pichia kluyveri]
MGEDATISLFDLYFPLPYRVLMLVNLGLLMWHLNLLACKIFKIDILMVLKISQQELTLSKLLYRSKKRLLNVSLVNSVNYFIYLFLVANEISLTVSEWFPLFGIICTFIILLKNDPSYESARLNQTIKRVIRGDIDVSIRNNDILLTDTFTSYNKVLVDFFIYISALILGMQTLPNGSDLSKELSKNHLQFYNFDVLLANFPSFLRLKQCLKEFNLSNKQNMQHLFNAIKYSTAFLPTISIILFKSGILKSQSLWYFTTFINSSYSFYWDITNDWNFGFFSKFLSSKSNVKILRNKLLYNKPVYYLAIIIDFQLRFLWFYKLIYLTSSSPSKLKNINSFANFITILFTTEFGNFLLEILEIFRRWVWVFLKVETEYIKLVSSTDFIEMQSFD